MYLKSLQLIGFKSFAEKTKLEFLPGVTAVVGPNGCGKSNIADAIRWVLGEQSAKALRGAEMADVIFNGTDGRKAIGMAEVSMTFADVDPKTLSLPGVNLDFTEVTITRRVYRDGAGEYLINKTPCRLRDIQTMFMDTGIGRSSYSLMAQGQIDQILSAHPEDRRMIFEEAAGINKYKHQKKEALRKLEYTEANLVRLTDIIKEVKRQIISLQRQAGKARRYKELFDQLKSLDTRLSRHKYDALHSEISNLESQIAEIAARSEQFAAEIADRETQISDLRRSLNEIERAISAAVNQDHELRSETNQHQQRIATNNERITDSEQLIANHHREIAGNEEKVRVQEELLAQLNAEFDQIDFLLAAEQGKLQAQQDDIRSLDADLNQKNRTLGEARGNLMALESQSANNRNELGALDHKKKHDLIRAEKLTTERLQLEEQRRTLESRLTEFQKGAADERSLVVAKRAMLTAQTSALQSAAQNLQDANQAHQQAVNDLSKTTARLEVLQQMFAAPGGRLTLGNILEVEPQFGPAIEAALNHSIHAILADNLETARALLTGTLKNPSIAVPELCGGTRSVASEDVPPGAMAWATNVAKVKDARFEPLIRSLLHNVVIAGDLDAALTLRQQQPALKIATVPGQFADEHGVLSAVSNSHIAEITTLTEQTGQLQARVTELANRKAELETAKHTAEEELTALRAELHAKEVTLAGREGELNAINTEHRDLASKVHTVVFELEAIEQQDTEEKRRRAEIQAALAQAEQREKELRDQMAEIQQFVTELTAQKEQMTADLTEFRVSVGSIQAKRDSIIAQREPIAGRIRDLNERKVTCTAEIGAYTARIEQFRAEITESEQRIVELAASRQESQQQIAGLQHQRDEVATGIEHAENELRDLRGQAYAAQQQKSGLDVSLAQKRMELQGLKERVWQKYQINVEDIRSENYTITVADGATEPVSQEVAAATDWDAMEAQVAEIQSKLDAMGPVNVEAIQEFDELEQRHQHLSQQHEDLIKAKEQLLQIIAKINATTKQLFSETFEKVKENFQNIFTELFGGGKANLILLDENDPLESGIEIVAKPPGKQLQSITLLSGGEKTLTATALLFSIYMVKPSPFCVLDELDAPLDESNINRFIRILQRFITLSQFVVITHNKRTIGMADALYGITMEEHGVSKVVSVKFSPREETKRKEEEKQREQQEERIDGAATVTSDLRPHEEELRNDLLVQKEQTVAPINEDVAPVVAEVAPVLSAAPAPIADEVKAVVAAVTAVNESAKTTVAEAQPEPDTAKA
jgi:chromosome segregation protein